MRLWGGDISCHNGGVKDVSTVKLPKDGKRKAQLQDLGEGRMSRANTDDWGTPDWLMALFTDWHDPCQLGQERCAPDNLEGAWEIGFMNRIYINPPYSYPKPWVEKAIRTHQKLGTTIVMLLKHDSSTQWYRMLKEAGARFLMIEGRLRFKALSDDQYCRGKVCSFPSVLVVLS